MIEDDARHAGQPSRHPRARRPSRRNGRQRRRGPESGQTGPSFVGDHSRPPAARRDRRAALAQAQGRWPRGRRHHRDRSTPTSKARSPPSAGGDRLHPQADQPRRLRASLGAIAERQRARAGQGAKRGRIPHLVEAAQCLIVILRPDHAIVLLQPRSPSALTGYSAAKVLGPRLRRHIPACRTIGRPSH